MVDLVIWRGEGVIAIFGTFFMFFFHSCDDCCDEQALHSTRTSLRCAHLMKLALIIWLHYDSTACRASDDDRDVHGHSKIKKYYHTVHAKNKTSRSRWLLLLPSLPHAAFFVRGNSSFRVQFTIVERKKKNTGKNVKTNDQIVGVEGIIKLNHDKLYQTLLNQTNQTKLNAKTKTHPRSP